MLAKGNTVPGRPSSARSVATLSSKGGRVREDGAVARDGSVPRPSTIFFDEIYLLVKKREARRPRARSFQKSEDRIDGSDGRHVMGQEQTVIVLAATNRPWELDAALRRALRKRVRYSATYLGR